VGSLCRAVARLEANPFPVDMTYVRRMFDGVGPHMSLPYRFLFANMRLFSPLIRTFLEKDPQMAASIRTTIAPTMFEAGVKENVLPDDAQAVVNFRILPGETVETVVNRVKSVIDDPEIDVAIRDSPDEPSPVSSTDSEAFKLLRNSILGMPGNEAVVVAPYLAVGAADARHYAGVAKNVLRFLPCHVTSEDLKSIHGVDERISVENMVVMARFYAQLIINGNEWQGAL
jgi:carboxypeptidase PM20D1